MPLAHSLIKSSPFSAAGSPDRVVVCSSAWPRLEWVVIADALPLFRAGLAQLVQASSPGVSIKQSGSISEVWQLAGRSRVPDLLLIDLGLPGMEIAYTLPRLRRIFRTTSIMAMSLDEDDATVAEAIRSGCDGFIHKGLPRDKCSRAIRQMLAGACVVVRSDCSIAKLQASSPAIDQAVALTGRQREVLSLLSEGASNKFIGRELGISHLTVRLHVSSLLRIFGVTKRTEVAPKARTLGLIGQC